MDSDLGNMFVDILKFKYTSMYDHHVHTPWMDGVLSRTFYRTASTEYSLQRTDRCSLGLYRSTIFSTNETSDIEPVSY